MSQSAMHLQNKWHPGCVDGDIGDNHCHSSGSVFTSTVYMFTLDMVIHFNQSACTI
jgi:hypothetical protein